VYQTHLIGYSNGPGDFSPKAQPCAQLPPLPKHCGGSTGATGCPFFQNCTSKFVHYSQKFEFRTIFKQCLKMRYSQQRLCLHFGIQNIEFYSKTIYIFVILEFDKLSRHNNQALQEHKMK
jgi:hypothetical protein